MTDNHYENLVFLKANQLHENLVFLKANQLHENLVFLKANQLRADWQIDRVSFYDCLVW